MIFKSADSGSKNAWLYLLAIVCCFPFFRNMAELPFWPDELQTWKLLQLEHPLAIKQYYATTQQHPPLYFLIVKIISWFYPYVHSLLGYCVFGKYFLIQHFSPLVNSKDFLLEILPREYNQNLLGGLYSPRAEYGLRFPSALFIAAATVFGAHKIRHRLGYLAAGLFAVMMALNQTMINLAQEAKPGALAAMICFFVFFEFIENHPNPSDLRSYRKLFLLQFFCVLTGYYAAIFVFMGNVYLAAKLRKVPRVSRIFAVVAAVLAGILITVLASSRPDAFKFLEVIKPEQVPLMFSMIGVSMIKYRTMLAIWAVVFGVWLWRRRDQHDEFFATAVFFLLGSVVCVAVLCLIKPMFTSRYLDFLTPAKLAAMTAAAFMVSGAAVQMLKSEVSRLAWRNTIALVFVLIFSVSQARTSVAEQARLLDSASGDFPIDAAYRSMHRKAKTKPVVYAIRQSRILPTEYYDFKHRTLNVMVIPGDLTGDAMKAYFEAQLKERGLDEIFYLQIRENNANEPLAVIHKVAGYREEVSFARHRLTVTRYFKGL